MLSICPAVHAEGAADNAAYAPKKKNAYISTSYNYGMSRSTTFNSLTNTKTSSAKQASHSISQRFGYGLNDRLTLRMGVSYIPANTVRTTTVSGIQQTQSSQGFSNVSVGTTYRLHRQTKTSPLNWDMLVDYSPDILDAKRPNSENADGTVALGGQVFGLAARISHVEPTYSIAGVVGENYYGRRKIQIANTPNHLDNSAYASTFVGIQTQYRVTDLLALDTGVRYTKVGKSAITNSTNGLRFERNPGDFTSLSAGISYQIVPKRFVTSFDYYYSIYGDTKNTYANPASDNHVEIDSSHRVGVTLQYFFN
jgi:opacity protein-like surface antigen